jgi:hypothetical protein
MTFREVAISNAPGVFALPIFQPPRILLGLPPSDQLGHITYAIWETTEDAKQRAQALMARGVSRPQAHTRIPLGPFLRTLAKIAHGYDVANFGIQKTDNTLNPYILRKDDKTPYLIGGTPPNGPIPIIIPIPREHLHQIYPFGVIVDGMSYIAIQMRLFAQLGPQSPVYTVIVRPHPIAEGEPHFTIVTKK